MFSPTHHFCFFVYGGLSLSLTTERRRPAGALGRRLCFVTAYVYVTTWMYVVHTTTVGYCTANSRFAGRYLYQLVVKAQRGLVRVFFVLCGQLLHANKEPSRTSLVGTTDKGEQDLYARFCSLVQPSTFFFDVEDFI